MSRTVPTGARPEWPHEPERSQGYNGEQSVPGSGYGDRSGAPGPEYGGQAYGSARQGNEGYDGRAGSDQGYNGQASEGQGHGGQGNGQPAYDGTGYAAQGYGDQGYAGQRYDAQANGNQGYGGQGYNGQAQGSPQYNGQVRGAQGYNGQAQGNPQYNGQAQGSPQYNGQAQGSPQYNGQVRGALGYNGQAQGSAQYNGQVRGAQQHNGQANGSPGYNGQASEGQGHGGQGNGQLAYDGTGYAAQGYGDQGYAGQRYDAQANGNQGYGGHGYDAPGYGPQGYGPERGAPDQPTRQYDGYGDPRRRQGRGYPDQAAGQYGHQGNGDPRGYPDTRRGSPPPGRGERPTRPGQRKVDGPTQPGQRKVRLRRTRRFVRRPAVRVIGALFGVFLIWVMFSVGQAVTANNGQSFSSNLAEWARGHYLGPVVTFGEWLSYNPPQVGGKPSFSLAVPKGEAASAAKVKGKHGFQPYIPATLKSLTPSPLAGEGQWRVVEKVKGQPAIFTTFLRDATYTSNVSGIASMDQRLVTFQMHPGSQDPGPGNWGEPPYIPQGSRTGLLATFNGGFKLDSSQGGFYLNGQYHGSLVTGAASVVYYKNGTIKIGAWGSEVTMTPQVEGVRQNLKLLIDHGKAAPNLNQNVQTNFGATLGGGYYVWRSGLGITKDGRIIYVYGSALNVQDLADLLQRAGAVEGMQMDINPYWMSYEYYTGNLSDPTPNVLMPTQQTTAYRYYSPYTRDFTAVYAR